jgi:CheY-like chemotaxis protein
MNILIADDNHTDILLIQTIFRDAGFRCHWEVLTDGEEVLHHISRKGLSSARLPDVILLDLCMPKVDGLQVLQKLKNDPDWCSIPVILFTGMQLAEQKIPSYENGPILQLEKPFEMDGWVELPKMIRRHALSGPKFQEALVA